MPLSEGQLRLGRLFESEFERQMHLRGHHVVRHCDQLGVTGTKAPVITGPFAGYRLPDFTVLARGASHWVEAKYKGRQTYHGLSSTYEHGIDLPNWRDYQKVCGLSGLPGYLVIGEGHSGRIIIARFDSLARVSREYNGSEWFTQGAVFWPADAFRPWGHFNVQTGQMQFDFTFSADAKGAAA
jgi:hypothetical protein